jgi:hypothetical protein
MISPTPSVVRFSQCTGAILFQELIGMGEMKPQKDTDENG